MKKLSMLVFAAAFVLTPHLRAQSDGILQCSSGDDSPSIQRLHDCHQNDDDDRKRDGDIPVYDPFPSGGGGGGTPQFGGCDDSPENPTLILAGLAAGAYVLSTLRNRPTKRTTP